MAVGQTAQLAGLSYVAIGRETTLGTAVTCTADIECTNVGLRTTFDSKILPQIERNRTMSKRIQTVKMVQGPLDFYLAPELTATGYILQNAFAGTVTSATATGETAGGAAMTHTFVTGNFDQTYKSLSANIRKGNSSIGEVFAYQGLRVNELSLQAELDDGIKVSVGLIGMDSTIGASSVESFLTSTAYDVCHFANGRFSIESTFGSLTSSSFWHAQSFNFKLSNNLKTGAEARRIGSATLSDVPYGIQSYELSATIRFDTSTAFDAMIAATELAGEIEFLGRTLTGSAVRQGLKIQFQKLQIKDAGDPEISGPDGILTSQVTFDVLRDESATGYAVRGLLTNAISSLA